MSDLSWCIASSKNVSFHSSLSLEKESFKNMVKKRDESQIYILELLYHCDEQIFEVQKNSINAFSTMHIFEVSIPIILRMT